MKRLTSAVSVIAASAFLGVTVQAQTVLFAGNTQGCFAATFTTGCAQSFDGITFTGSTFSQMVPANGVTGFGSLGTFSLGAGGMTGSTMSQPFVLFVTLTNPDINGAPPGNAQGPINGMLAGSVNSGGFLTFSPNSLTFGFTDPSTMRVGTGHFAFSTPTGVQPTVGGTITGALTLTTSTVPEPSSMALLGTGLVGLVPVMRRRRRNT